MGRAKKGKRPSDTSVLNSRNFMAKRKPLLSRSNLQSEKGNKLIILTDHEDHWISAIDYQNKHLKVIDPRERRVKKELTPKELAKWCLNFNKKSKETYYYGIIILSQN
jgi:hypothetical protein